MGPVNESRQIKKVFKTGKLETNPDRLLRQELLREQLLRDRRLLMESRRSSHKKTYTFGSFLPVVNEKDRSFKRKAGEGSGKGKLASDHGENIRVTELLETIRKKGSKERMDFITRRMGFLRGEDKPDTGSLLSIIKNNIRANCPPPPEPTKPEILAFVSNFSNTLQDPGRRPSVQEVGAVQNISKGVRFLHKLEDNEMLQLINLDEKAMQFLISKNKEKDPEVKKVEPIVTIPAPERPTEEKPGGGSFMFLGDRHVAIRNFLLNRGWTEKYTLYDLWIRRYDDQSVWPSYGTPEEYQYVKRLLQTPNRNSVEEPVNFIWLNGWLNWSNLSQRVVVSRIPSNCPFTKTNMSLGLKNTLPFLFEKSEINARIPRTFEIRIDGDMKNFQKNYKITTCICILKKFVSGSANNMTAPDGTIPLDVVDFAIKRTIEVLQVAQNEDLDDWNFSIVKDGDWENFLLRFYDITHYDAKFKNSDLYDIGKLNACCKKLLDMIYKLYPEMKYEGMKNLWICKPARGSCGRGVRVYRKLKDIEQYCKPENQHVIQKYIEMPLLIYSTKFDIRQWFVISSVSPMIVWMYDECYLRFCSQEFCLTNLHESVHLCNNTIQWKYKNGVRSSKLPADNMWDCHEFAEFLKKELKQDGWPSIQEQMREAIIAACSGVQERLYQRANSFQLYGADFMLTPDLRVWLIEINSQPAMKYSTTVTTRMCRSVLEDTIKVGILHKTDPQIKVGKFREIYHQATEHPKTVLPPGGIVYAKKSTLLPNGTFGTSEEPTSTAGKTNLNPKVHKLSYEYLANYKSHPRVQIKPSAKSDKPLYPGDSTIFSIEESVVLVDNKDLIDNTKINKNNEKTEKDGEKCQTIKKKIIHESQKITNSDESDNKSKENKTIQAKQQSNLLKDNENNEMKDSATLLMKKIKESKLWDKYSIENRSEMINLIGDGSDNEYGNFENGDNDNKSSGSTICSSFNDVYTHDIITGDELLPELSGYMFIGESSEDRKLECVLNSPEFLSCIGKNDEKIRPIYKEFINSCG